MGGHPSTVIFALGLLALLSGCGQEKAEPKQHARVFVQAVQPTDYAVAVTAGSSMLSPIIPPSIAMILYSYYTEIPVMQAFRGGRRAGVVHRPAADGLEPLSNIRGEATIFRRTNFLSCASDIP